MSSTIEAVIFDWAGTTVDHGSIAPVEALREVFSGSGISLTNEQIRQDMGLHKREHIKHLLHLPPVSELWQTRSGRPPSDDDVDVLYQKMIVVQTRVLLRYSKPIPGVHETAEFLRRRGIKIGSTTGYNLDMMRVVSREAGRHGYVPDCVVTPDDVAGGRPYPWMIFENAILLKVIHLSHCVKVGDTISDIEEGKNAGLWTVGVTRTGNMCGLDEQEWGNLSAAEQSAALAAAEERFRAAGADYTIPSIADLPPVLEKIEKALESGLIHTLFTERSTAPQI